MADREFEINVRVSGESGDFQRSLDGLNAELKSFRSELADVNRTLLGVNSTAGRAADNLQKVGTQGGYAARALGSLTRFTRQARDELQHLASSAKDSRTMLGELDLSTRVLQEAQQNLARRLDSVVIPAFNRQADVLDQLSRRLIMTGSATGDLAREQREAAIAAEAEASALDDVGDSADKAAVKLTILAAAQDRASRSSVTPTVSGPALGGGGDQGGGVNVGGLLYHRGIGGRLPWWMGGAVAGTVGAGGLLPMAGLGPERLLTTPLAIAASAIPAAGGAAAIGLGALGTAAVGGGSDMAVMKSTIADTKTLFTAYENLKKAQEEYGKSSKQAAQAQAELNFQMNALGPAAGVELALAKSVVKLNVMWDKVTAKARGSAVSILDQVVSLAHDYVGKVASAAAQNLAIIDKDIKPLFAWLKGPEGMGIWNNLESKFKQDLPIAIDAFTNGLELLLRIVNLSSKYVGGFLKSIDDHLAKWNGYSDLKLSGIIQHLVDDFRIWERFIKSAGKALYDLFHNASGEGFAVLQLFTKWLNKFNEWSRTAQGSQWLKTFFQQRKDELIALIKLIGEFTKGWFEIYKAVQPLVPVFTTILNVLTKVLGAIGKISPALQTAIAAYVMFGKYVGFGKVNSAIGLSRGAVAGAAASGGLGAAASGAAAAGGAGILRATSAESTFLRDMGKVGAADANMGFGAAVSRTMEGGVVGGMAKGLQKGQSLLTKAGPLLKTGLAFWVGTGLLEGFSQGFASGTKGSFIQKFGNSIGDALTKTFGGVSNVFENILNSLGGIQGSGNGGVSQAQSGSWLLGQIQSLNNALVSGNWGQVKTTLGSIKSALADAGNEADQAYGKKFVDAAKKAVTATDSILNAVKRLSDLTSPQAAKIISSFQSVATESGSAMQNMWTAVHTNMQNIAQDIGLKSKQGKQALVFNFEEAANFMASNYSKMGVGTSKAMGFIVSMLSQAAAAGSGSFAGLINNMTDAEKRMLLNTHAGLKELTDAINNRLKAMHMTPIPAGSVTTPGGQLLTYTPTHKITANLFGNSSNASTGGFGAARGSLIQVGAAGDRGRDAIPMSVGGTNIVVGSGEQVAVLNHSQQSFLNQRLSDVGGLPGMFQSVTKPHYMAGGGLLPSIRGPVSTFGPPGEAAHSMATGYSDTMPALALRIPGTHWDDPRNRALLGHNFRVSIAGHSAVLPDLDLGPNESTGRDIDVTGAGVARLGIPYGSYPTDSIGTAVPVGGTSGLISSMAGAIYNQIVAPRVHGGGAIGELTQGAMNDVAKAANQYLSTKEAGMAGASASALGAVGAGFAKFGGKGAHGAYAGLIPGRVDQGMDFGGAGPVYSVLPGKVLQNTEWPGWPGSGGVVYSTPKGNVYIMEDFKAAVWPGEVVKQGQLVGVATGGSSGIETGWANAAGTGPLTPYNGAADGTPMPGGYDFKSFIGYEDGGLMDAMMMRSGGYPKKSHVKPTKTPKGSGGSHKHPKISTTGWLKHTHLPKVKGIPGLPGINPGFNYLYNDHAYIEPVVKGWPVKIPPSYGEGLAGGLDFHHLAPGGYQGQYFLHKPPLEQYLRGSGGNAQAITDAQSFMGLLQNELSLIQDTQTDTGAPKQSKRFAFGQEMFYPNEPANPHGYIGAWKIDQEIAGNMGILAMMRLQEQGSRRILGEGLPKYAKNTKQSLQSYVHRALEEIGTYDKLQRYQRYGRAKDNPALKLSEEHRIHDEFTKARAKLHVREIKGKYSANTTYNFARGVLEQTRTDELKGLAAANILDPTQESILAASIEGEYAQSTTKLNQLRNTMLEKKEIDWARASMFLSLAEQDALYGINHGSDVLRHQDSLYGIEAIEVHNKYEKTKHNAELIANDLFAADSSQISGHLAKNLSKIGWSRALTPSFGGADIKHEILNIIQNLEDPSNGIPAYKHFIIPQLEQQRNQITGSTTTGAADSSELIQLLEQQLSFRASDFAVAEQQLRALRSFTPVLGQMVGSFAGGTLQGRVIPETGYALVHRGETVAPDPEGPFGSQFHSGGHGDVTVEAPVYLSLHGGMRMMEDFIDARIEKRAPGIVNSALGKRSRRLSNAPGPR